MRTLRFGGIVLLTLGCLTSSLGAQGFGAFPGGSLGGQGNRGPALSPYLNLGRVGIPGQNTGAFRSPAANYYLGVLPEFDRRATKVRQGAALQDLSRRLDAGNETEDGFSDLGADRLPPTGHITGFGNNGGYFPSTGVGTPQRTTGNIATPRTRRR